MIGIAAAWCTSVSSSGAEGARCYRVREKKLDGVVGDSTAALSTDDTRWGDVSAVLEVRWAMYIRLFAEKTRARRWGCCRTHLRVTLTIPTAASLERQARTASSEAMDMINDKHQKHLTRTGGDTADAVCGA